MIKVGVIGCGVISATHIEGYQKLPDVEVIHISDLIPEKMQEKGDKYGINRRSCDYRELLADPEVDLVSVCTDHASHVQIVCDALEAGKHVVCEKSLGRVPEDMDKMVAAAAKHPELVASGIFQHRFEPHNIRMKKLIADGAFGKILMVNLHFRCRRTDEYYIKDAWRGTQSGEGGGILINQAIHHLDQLRFLFGNIVAVSAHTANLTHQGVIEVEDTATFTIEFENGVTGVVAATNSSPVGWCSNLFIDGDLAVMNYVNENCEMVFSLDKEREKMIRETLSDDREEATVAGKAYYGSGHVAQLLDVVDAIREKRAPGNTLAEAASTSALVMAVYSSARNNGARTPVKNYV
ncbi:MAG: Gfo/Idh/MocA family oxidoreductase [Lentisphaeria bacterium]|nr:Gfo/Idh/MocA family oxidoreductase [Lentisphaeria bacterium]